MPFDLLSPTGSMQYDFPVNYVFESLYAQNPGSDLQQLVVGQLYPAGTPIGYAPGLAQSTPWSGIIGIPVGLVSSSAQAATWTVASASVAQTAISASWAPGIGGATTWDAVSGKPDGLLSSSVQVNAILDADGVISSSAQISYLGLSNVPTGIVSSSAQAATWTVASSSVATSASWAAVAVSASWAPGVGGGTTWSSISGIPSGLVSSSAQLPAGLVSSSAQVNYTGLANIPAGIVSASTQIIPLLPLGTVSSSAQITYSGISNVPSGIISSSAQVNAILDADGVISSSVQVQFDSISGRPTGLVSSSAQVNYPQLSNIPVGIVSSSTQANGWAVATASVATSASYALVAQNVLGSITSASYALTASYALSGGGGGSGDAFPFTGAATISGSLALTGSAYGNVTTVTVTSRTGSFDLRDGNFFIVTLPTGSVFFNVTNVQPGQTVNILVNTNTAGTASFSSNVRQATGSAYVPSTSGSQDVLTLVSWNASVVYLANLRGMV
jgi:hypothetical protein